MPSRPASPSSLPASTPGPTPPATKPGCAWRAHAKGERNYADHCKEMYEQRRACADAALADYKIVDRAYELIDYQLKLADATTFLPALWTTRNRLAAAADEAVKDLDEAKKAFDTADHRATIAERELAQAQDAGMAAKHSQ